jgi:hypothetical protein
MIFDPSRSSHQQHLYIASESCLWRLEFVDMMQMMILIKNIISPQCNSSLASLVISFIGDIVKKTVFIAGHESEHGYQDGQGKDALFYGINGLAFHPSKRRLVISDYMNDCIRYIDL